MCIIYLVQFFTKTQDFDFVYIHFIRLVNVSGTAKYEMSNAKKLHSNVSESSSIHYAINNLISVRTMERRSSCEQQ